jgi:hypothetical protein
MDHEGEEYSSEISQLYPIVMELAIPMSPAARFTFRTGW